MHIKYRKRQKEKKIGKNYLATTLLMADEHFFSSQLQYVFIERIKTETRKVISA